MSLVGYARVSSVSQSLDIQIEKLKQYGCDEIFSEKLSGIDQNRPELISCLRYVRKKDTLVITRLDRMARSALHLGQIIEKLEKDEVNLIVLDQNIDTTTSQGKLMFHMLSSFAEFENDIRKERQKEGIDKAIKNGRKFGRPKKIDSNIVLKTLNDSKANKTISSILKDNEISKSTYFRIKQGKYNHLIYQ